ncbi:MAG: Na/Pi cotransporter family protein [Ruminococcaceae bacterium]|nr:Na/Pi cotransporter family protein [Oscillospiraceae bacterium]
MDIFSVITLMGGLAFFLYGMTVMSSGLERMSGGKLERSLKKMTSNPFTSLLLGAGITIAIQSSSAMTVMLVGLVNSGIMDISQTVGVIMGSNIGTTLTAWLLSLVGLETDNVWIKMLKPENFSLLFAFIGILLIMISKSAKKKDIGAIFVGFAVLMFGMELMGNAVSPLADMPEFSSLLTAFENPLLGVLVGAIFTGVIQSSAASVAILQALALTGKISYGMAIPVIMGQNIGTCVTAIISSIGVNRNAKKVAVIHISFNVIGTGIFLAIYYGLRQFIDFSFESLPIGSVGIAAAHSIFNIATTLMLLPFSKLLVKIANFFLRDSKKSADDRTELVDDRLLNTPTVAIAECDSLTAKMAIIAKDTLLAAIDMVGNYSEDKAKSIYENENTLDLYEDRLSTYLVKISSKTLSESDSHKVSKILHAIGDFERLGDHAVNILKTAKELYDKDISFSDKAQNEIQVLTEALKEILTITTSAYENNDLELATQIEPLEQVIDNLVYTIRNNHIARLQAGNCTIEMGFILSDLLTNYERVSDHCSNLAASMIELSHNTFDTHKYLNTIKYGNRKFNESYEQYRSRYFV